MFLRRSNWSRIVVECTGATLSSLGVSVLVAWHFHFTPLIQVLPGMPPMHRMSALGFLLAGVALILIGTGHGQAARVFAVAMLIPSLLVALEYLLNLDFGVDQFLGPDYISPSISHVGRLSPFTTFCFLAGGLSLLAMSSATLARRTSGIVGIASSVLIAVGSVPALAHLGRAQAYGWGYFSWIAIHTGLGDALLGAGLLALALQERTEEGLPRWIAPSVGLGIGVAALGVWQGLLTHQESTLPVLSGIVLSGGFLLGVLLAVAISQTQESRSRGRNWQEEKANLERLFEAVPDGLMVTDNEGRIIRANQRVESVFGCARADLLGQSIETFVPLRLRELDGIREVYYLHPGARPTSQFSLHARRKDGSEFPVDVSLGQLQSGNEIQVLIVVRDVSERKQAEEALRRSEERFRGVFEISPIGLALIQPDYRLAKVNPSLCRMSGYSEAELVGMNPFDITHPDDRKMSMGLAERLFRGEIPFYQVEKRYIKKDGGIIWGNMTATILRDLEGRPLAGLGMIQDITERKHMEAKLEASREQMVASARLSALGMMAGGIAHEINNPLSIIHAMASDLEEMVEEEGSVPTQVVARKSAIIRETAERIARIVKAMRQISREGAGDPFRSARLTKILGETLEICQARFKANDVKLLIPQDVPELNVFCREVQIEQALLNLLQNALDAVLEQKGERWVKLEVFGRGDSVSISVIDSGPGIRPEHRSRIMEPFFTTKDVGKGVGLGLSLSKTIAEEHGGKLECSEDHGHTRFSLLLPLARTVEAA